MPLGLTDRDRQEIRTGRNWTIGERHASLLFWGPIWGRLLGYAAVAAVAVVAVVKAHDVWVGGFGDTAAADWPVWLLAAVAVVVAVLMFPRGSRRRSRRRRRRRR